MDRLTKFEAMAIHPWFNRVYKRLKPIEVTLAKEFINAHNHLSHWEYEMAINRMFLDKPELRVKYKHWVIIQELLAASNPS